MRILEMFKTPLGAKKRAEGLAEEQEGQNETQATEKPVEHQNELLRMRAGGAWEQSLPYLLTAYASPW